MSCRKDEVERLRDEVKELLSRLKSAYNFCEKWETALSDLAAAREEIRLLRSIVYNSCRL